MANWKNFAKHEMIGIAENEGELHQFESSLSENPTAQLFQYLGIVQPNLKLGKLYDVLSSDSVNRPGTANRLKDLNGMCYLPMMKLSSRLKTVILKLDTHCFKNQTRLIFMKGSYLVARL